VPQLTNNLMQCVTNIYLLEFLLPAHPHKFGLAV
jgi:hypothetical protein